MKYKTTMLVLLVLTIGIFGLSNIANTLHNDVNAKTKVSSLGQGQAVAAAPTCNINLTPICTPEAPSAPVVLPEADNDNEVMINPISRFIILQ